jgi:uncharacterized membrane protein
MLLIAPLCAFEKPGQPDRLLTPGRRIGFAAVAFGAELILAYTQYIVSNPVGSRSLEGMQPRYFIPVWISLLLGLVLRNPMINMNSKFVEMVEDTKVM